MRAYELLDAIETRMTALTLDRNTGQQKLVRVDRGRQRELKLKERQYYLEIRSRGLTDTISGADWCTALVRMVVVYAAARGVDAVATLDQERIENDLVRLHETNDEAGAVLFEDWTLLDSDDVENMIDSETFMVIEYRRTGV